MKNPLDVKVATKDVIQHGMELPIHNCKIHGLVLDPHSNFSRWVAMILPLGWIGFKLSDCKLGCKVYDFRT